MTEIVTDIKSEILEGGYAVLTGGCNFEGQPIISFPPDRTEELQQCSTSDLLLLLQYYVRISGPKVAIHVSMRDRWTEPGISKAIAALDELQTDQRGTISSVCILKPTDSSKLRILKRCLLRKNANGRLLPFYKVHLLESEEKFLCYADKSQLTVDFGGTLLYNHVNWVDFQKFYITLLAEALTLQNNFRVIIKQVMKLRESGAREITPDDDDVQYRKKEIRAKFESILSKHNVRKIIERCQNAVEKLDNPVEDTILIQVQHDLIIATKSKLKDKLAVIQPELDEMANAISAVEDEMDILAKLQECRKTTNEVEETINLLSSQIPDRAVVGRDVTEAANYRGYFVVTALEPSKDILACATAILKNLDGGSKTTQRTYNIAFEIAKQLTQAIQPFTNMINKLNEEYTRIHVFHVIFEKVVRWKSRASIFIFKSLFPFLNSKDGITSHQINTEDIEMNEQLKTKMVTYNETKNDTDNGKYMTDDNNEQLNSKFSRLERIDKETHVSLTEIESLHSFKHNSRQRNQNLESQSETGSKQIPYNDEAAIVKECSKFEYNTYKSILIEPPSDWNHQLKLFYSKHPAPKKKHIKLLTKYTPSNSQPQQRSKINTVAERTLFILSFLRKKSFKAEEIIRIQQWDEEMNKDLNISRQGATDIDACILEVTLV